MFEQCLGRDQNARQAIAALTRLLVEKGLLQRVRPLRRAQTLDGEDGLAGDGRDGLAAGFLGMAVDQHHAAAALLRTAAEFRPDEAEMVAENIEQRRVRVRGDADGVAVDDQGYSLHR